jgi:hypothetical protein
VAIVRFLKSFSLFEINSAEVNDTSHSNIAFQRVNYLNHPSTQFLYKLNIRKSIVLRRGHTKETSNRNFRELLSTELNTWNWMEQRKLRKRQRNSAEDWGTQLPGNGAGRSIHNCVAAWFPSVSCSLTRFSDSLVSYDGAKGWRSC